MGSDLLTFDFDIPGWLGVKKSQVTYLLTYLWLPIQPLELQVFEDFQNCQFSPCKCVMGCMCVLLYMSLRGWGYFISVLWKAVVFPQETCGYSLCLSCSVLSLCVDSSWFSPFCVWWGACVCCFTCIWWGGSGEGVFHLVALGGSHFPSGDPLLLTVFVMLRFVSTAVGFSPLSMCVLLYTSWGWGWMGGYFTLVIKRECRFLSGDLLLPLWLSCCVFVFVCRQQQTKGLFRWAKTKRCRSWRRTRETGGRACGRATTRRASFRPPTSNATTMARIKCNTQWTLTAPSSCSAQDFKPVGSGAVKMEILASRRLMAGKAKSVIPWNDSRRGLEGHWHCWYPAAECSVWTLHCAKECSSDVESHHTWACAGPRRRGARLGGLRHARPCPRERSSPGAFFLRRLAKKETVVWNLLPPKVGCHITLC